MFFLVDTIDNSLKCYRKKLILDVVRLQGIDIPQPIGSLTQRPTQKRAENKLKQQCSFQNIIKPFIFRFIIGGVKYIQASAIPGSLIYAVLPYLGHSDIFCDYLSNSAYLLIKKQLSLILERKVLCSILTISPRPILVYKNRQATIVVFVSLPGFIPLGPFLASIIMEWDVVTVIMEDQAYKPSSFNI